ncbi:hypothetical protein TVAG_040660 [Trichomonas vaginalis G3]|uniref:Condensin complex subunit 1 C-terminal domain-containing protein n=1 Tax=Trichomonas vaginalis (strain ATCC PRA-98 / G3) TaxID=412133 RepID=A2EWM8_TRIV3|nr:armadillo (ARM) repeat-containing protein family [Trichomonas vaginalis G3]EAY02916.1 hypothetical protein TVAG_040660 [Trichomonas vaginalis G3]KAI5521762.1 armadillo (ARM) repeat-containing protein family [Trichomonas vaginalis G3]|eukprot:XP_001315139.1 hypothetical protein [Trichomonas vaginalis G3]
MEKIIDNIVEQFSTTKSIVNSKPQNNEESCTSEEKNSTISIIQQFITNMKNENYDIDRDNEMLISISNICCKMNQRDCLELFDSETFDILTSSFLLSTPSIEIYSHLLDILASISIYYPTLQPFLSKEFQDALFSANERGGQIKVSAEIIFTNLVKTKEYFENYPMEFILDFWMKMIDMDLKSESYAFLNHEVTNDEDIIEDSFNLVKLDLLNKGVCLFLNDNLSVASMSNLLHGIYINLRSLNLNTSSSIIRDIFVDEFMEKSHEIYSNRKFILNTYFIFLELVNRNVYSEQLSDECLDLVTSAMGKEQDSEIFMSSILYYTKMIEKRKVPLDKQFIHDVSDLIDNSPFNVRIAAINLIKITADYQPELLSDISGEIIEVIAQIVLSSDPIISVAALKTLNTLHYSCNEIVAKYLIEEFDQFEEFQETLQEIIENEDLSQKKRDMAFNFQCLLDKEMNQSNNYNND